MGHCDPSVQRPRPGAQIFEMSEEQNSLFLRMHQGARGGSGRPWPILQLMEWCSAPSGASEGGPLATHHHPAWDKNTSPAELPRSDLLSLCTKAGGLSVLAEPGWYIFITQNVLL